MPKQRRRIYCKFCDYFCFEPEDYVSHLEKHHYEMIPEDMSVWQFSYFLKTGRKNGNCVVCKKPTTWNEKTHKYNRFCGNPKCKEKYREVFKNRMIGKYGKTHLLNDPEQQKKMLAHRKISGTYIWKDRVSKFTYTGSYEKAFLEFLDQVMNFDSGDLMAPSPHTYYYTYEGEKHFYIPDFFIPSLNLEIEIKDGGDNANKHPKIQAVDKVKEKLKDEVMMKNQFNYIKIVNQEHEKFFKFLNQAKYQYLEKDNKPIYMVEKEMTLEDLNELYTESSLYESVDKSTIDKKFKKKTGGNFKFIDVHDPNARKYLYNEKYFLKNYRSSLNKLSGEIVVEVDTNNLAGLIYISNDNKNSGFIEYLNVDKKYRGHGLSNTLIKDAISKYKASELVVYKDNAVAINLYKKHGFVIVGYGNDKNKGDYWMKLKSKLSKNDKVMTESLDTLLTTNPFIKEITLYHGSDKILNTIKPLSKNVGNKLNKNVRLSSFWGDDFEWCKYWALGVLLLNNGCKLLFNNFLDKSRKYDKDFIVVKDNFNEILNKVKDKNIYVYTKTIDKKYVGICHTPVYSEYTIDIPVKPDDVKEFSVRDILSSYSFEILDLEEYKRLCKEIKNDIMTTKPISQFYKYYEYEKREKLNKIKNLYNRKD